VRLWRLWLRRALSGLLGLGVVAVVSLGQVSPAAADAIPADLALPSLAEMVAGACVFSGVETAGAGCAAALAVGTILVGAGVLFTTAPQAYQAITSAWSALTDGQKEEVVQNLDANGGQVVDPPWDMVEAAVAGALEGSTAGYAYESLFDPYLGEQAPFYVLESGSPGAVAQLSMTVPSDLPATAGWEPLVLTSQIHGVVGGDVTDVWPQDGNGNPVQFTFQVLINGFVVGYYQTVDMPGQDYQFRGTAYQVAAGDTLEVDIAEASGNQSGVPYALSAGAMDPVINWYDVSSGQYYKMYVGGAGDLDAAGALTDPTPTAEPDTLNVPDTLDQLVGAGTGTSVTTVTGGTGTIGVGAGAVTDTSVLSHILAAIEALPGDLADEFSPSAAGVGVLEADWSNLAASFKSVVPFSWIVDLVTALSSYFSTAGQSAMDYSFPWSYGSEAWVWHVNLGDMFGILPTIRMMSAWVLYGLLLLYGFLEARRWFGSGGAE